MEIKKSKSIGILGLGITGTSIYRYLTKYYPDKNIFCFDDQLHQREVFKKEFIQAKIVNIKDNKWKLLDMIFISPGINNKHLIHDIAIKNNIPIYSDIDLFYKENNKSFFICITGSNGKTTTISLMVQILKNAKLNFSYGGNIGVPVLDLEKNKDIYLLELSSFQTNLIKDLKPQITVILNLLPNHLDKHSSLEEYFNAKKILIDKSQIKIIGITNQYSLDLYEYYKNTNIDSKIKLISFSDKETYKHKSNIVIHNNILKDDIIDFEEQMFSLPKNILNPMNIAAAYIISKLLNIDNKFIFQSIAGFAPPKYRLEFLGKKHNISFYNDSKSTNTGATYFAISRLEKVFLIIGGIFKEMNLINLKNILHKIYKVYIIGTQPKIFEEFFKKNFIKYKTCISLENAFNDATKEAKQYKENVNILLSPASASFDQFRNFEHRGEVFSNLVNHYLHATNE